MRAKPIALFDSGVGGLTVFKAVHKLLPGESLIYLGDTARVPYGTKSHETIIRYALRAAEALAARDIKMLIVACNTATAAALPALQARFAPVPVLGVIEPGAKAATEASRKGSIAVIATEATVRGGAYQRAIQALLPNASVISRPCGLFVSLAEEGWIDGDAVKAVAERYLRDIFTGPHKPDTLLLGCTHFPLFTPLLRETAGADVTVVDSADAAAHAARAELIRLNLLGNAANPQFRFITTDNRERFARAGSLFLGSTLKSEDVELADI